MTETTPDTQSAVSSKILDMLFESLRREALAVKKYRMYSLSCLDPNLKTVLDHAQQMHAHHFDILLEYLRSQSKNTSAPQM